MGVPTHGVRTTRGTEPNGRPRRIPSDDGYRVVGIGVESSAARFELGDDHGGHATVVVVLGSGATGGPVARILVDPTPVDRSAIRAAEAFSGALRVVTAAQWEQCAVRALHAEPRSAVGRVPDQEIVLVGETVRALRTGAGALSIGMLALAAGLFVRARRRSTSIPIVAWVVCGLACAGLAFSVLAGAVSR